MGSEWRTSSLRELGVKLIDCDHKTPKAVEGGIPYIGIPQMDNGRIDFDAKPRLISEEDFIKWTKKANPTYGDIVLSRRCNSGETAYVPKNAKFALGQNLVILRPTGDRLYPEFLRWAVHGREWWNEVAKYLNPGAIFESLKCADIPKFKIKEPPKEQQIKIADMLSSISNKIQLNRQTNETLEKMAQALFKSWFVDFDPVIDNSLEAGNTIPDELQDRAERRQQQLAKPDHQPLPDDIRQLFPSEFELTEALGWVPMGWEPKPFGDLLELTIGGDWGKDVPDEKHTVESVIIRGTDIPKLASGSQSSAPARWVDPKKLKTRLLSDSDIVIEVSGGSPTQPTGRSIMMTKNLLDRLGGTVEPASFCRKFRPLNREIGLVLALHLQKIYADGKTWEYQNSSTGISNFQTKIFLANELVLIPKSNKLISEFYRTARPIIDRITNNDSINLTKLRDTLLPKLISGELRLPSDASTDTEQQLDKAAS